MLCSLNSVEQLGEPAEKLGPRVRSQDRDGEPQSDLRWNTIDKRERQLIGPEVEDGHWRTSPRFAEDYSPVRRAGSGAQAFPIRWSTPLAAILISVEVLKRSLGVNALYS